MAVTGEIADLPLPELLNMMRHRSGKLLLLETQQVSEMELHFTPGYLSAFLVNKRVLKTEPQIVDKLVAVTATPVGRFSFSPAPANSLLASVRIHVDRLALIIVSQVDEISVNRDCLAPPDRIYRLAEREGPAVHCEEQNLAEFLHHSQELLQFGINAERLAQIEQISVEQVQLYLYKLNLLGLVEPGRKDDLWAKLDSALQPKSTGLRLSMPKPQEQPAPPAERSEPSDEPRPLRFETGDRSGNKQRVFHLVPKYRKDEG